MSGNHNTNNTNGRNGRNGHNGAREKIFEFIREFEQAAREVAQNVESAFIGLKHALGAPGNKPDIRYTTSVFTHYACDIILDSIQEQMRGYQQDITQRDLYNMHAPLDGKRGLFSMLAIHGIDHIEYEIRERKFEGRAKAANEARMRKSLIRSELEILHKELVSRGINRKISPNEIKAYGECRKDVLELAEKTILALQPQ